MGGIFIYTLFVIFTLQVNYILMEVEIKRLEKQEIDLFKELLVLFEDVFEMENFSMPTDTHLRKVLKDHSFAAFVAISDNKLVGGLTSYIIEQYYSTSPLVYIYDLAIKTDFQRQGIGKMLMAAILTYGKEIGAEEVFVQADNIDHHALEFYKSTGGNAEKVVHFTYPLNIE